MSQETRVKVLTSDASHRWKKGEKGTLIRNNFPEKYHYRVRLEGEYELIGVLVPRDFYFMRHEIQILES